MTWILKVPPSHPLRIFLCKPSSELLGSWVMATDCVTSYRVTLATLPVSQGKPLSRGWSVALRVDFLRKKGVF